MLGKENSTPPIPSAEEFHSGDRKRRRKALSCFDCRRRKLRCDREYPTCGRCAAHGQTCTYEFEAPAGPATIDQLKSVSASGQTRALGDHGVSVPGSAPEIETTNGPMSQVRLPNLEEDMPPASTQGFGGLAVVSAAGAKARTADEDLHGPWKLHPNDFREITIPETIYFKGTSFVTQYYGGTNPTSQISHFPELRSFMKEAIMQHSSLPQVQRDVKGLQVKWKNEKAQSTSFSNFSLESLLPERDTADHLCNLYFETYEKSYRILHGPSFWSEYRNLWDNMKTARPPFIITVLLVMASVSCISTRTPPTYIGDSSKAREIAILWIEASDWWLHQQSEKYAYLGLWQIRCLLLLASAINVVKKKRTWTAAGHLMRQAMSAGFHRDPSLLGSKISVFDQEMRRRLWATIVELELQISIDRGMPSASAGIPSDTAAPMNIDDEDLKEEDEELPISKPKDKYTSTSYLYLSKRSLALRVSLNSTLNSLAPKMPHADVLKYDENINEALQDLPAWTNTGVHSKGSRALDVPRMLLDIQLRQFLLLVHGVYARKAESDSRYSLSKMVCFNAATRILDQYSKLGAAGNWTLALLRADVFRSAVLICHYAYVSSTIRNDISLAKLSNSFFQYVDGALSVLEERITRLGTGYTHYWYVSAANSLMHSKASLGNASAQKNQAVEKVLRQYYKILASQEDTTAIKELVPFSVIYKPTAVPAAVPTFEELLGSNLAPAGMQDANPYEYYFGDPAAWVFDDLPNFDELEIPL